VLRDIFTFPAGHLDLMISFSFSFFHCLFAEKKLIDWFHWKFGCLVNCINEEPFKKKKKTNTKNNLAEVGAGKM
jgi:hypothetical protein